MKKIIIFGNSGSGKSTLAKKISNKWQLAHLDLDLLAWSEDNKTERKPLKASSHQIKQFIKTNHEWVIEGCYSDLIGLASPKATVMIFINLSVEACIDNANKRTWEPHKYSSKDDQDANLEMLIKWIRAYYNRDDVCSLIQHQNLYDHFKDNKLMINENLEFESIQTILFSTNH